MKDKKRAKWDSARVRALREHMGLTQQEMADQLGTRQQTISEWETGMYQPRGATSTLLTMVAERAGFEYQPEPSAKKSRK
jgi:DNA-binding transcriptional regulator YiaG